MGLDDIGGIVPDSVKHVVKKGEHAVGKGIDELGDKSADGLDAVGLHGAADWTRDKSKSAANALGAHVSELELGQTDDPRKLVYGSVDKLRSTASHLRDFQTAFDKVGRGLRGLDTGNWRGKAADAWLKKAAQEPRKWFTAADACGKAAAALDDFADTVHWAQGQAREALDTYQDAEKSTGDARGRYDDAIRRAVGQSGGLPGTEAAAEQAAGQQEFHDPGAAGRKAAEDQLHRARRQRDDAAELARRAIRAARDAAPPKPSYGTRLMDGIQGFSLDSEHFTLGMVKGVAGAADFARGLNPQDPYNMTHPAEYGTGLNSLAAGMAAADNDPFGTGKAMLEGFSKDPAEGAGELVPQLIGTDGLGEAGEAGGAAERMAAERPPRTPAREVLDREGEPSRATPDEDTTSDGTDPVDLATGRMYLAQTDVVLPGALPLVFRRRVDSGYTAGRWFGPSWSSTADQRLEIDAEGVVLVTEDGLLLCYPHPAPGLPTLPSAGPPHPLERTADGDYTLTDPETGRTRHFAGPPGGGDGTAPLAEITDRNGHAVTFHHDPATGAPTAITHTAGYHLKLTTEDGRITALHLARPGGDTELARYGYTDGNLSSVATPRSGQGRPLRFGYDGRGRVVSWTDTNDRSYHYAYDERNRCVAEGGEAGHVALRIDYGDPDPRTGLRTTTVTTADGATTRHLVDANCQVVATTDPLGHTTRTERDARGRVVSRTDALGHTTRLEYDGAGRLVRVVRPDGREMSAGYNALGLPVEVTEADGAVWRQEFDARGNRTALTDPCGATTAYTYDGLGRLTAVTDPLGHTTGVRCDAAGLPLEVTDPTGATTRYRRDAFGRVTAVTDPLGATTRLRWTADGLLTSRTDPAGGEQRWTYDGEGNCTSHTDAAGGVTTFEYTHFDLLAARTGPDGARYEFAHDAALRLTGVTGPHGLTWSYAYDPAGRPTAETDFDGRTTRYRHDAAGRLVSRTDALGRTTRYAHDPLGNTTERTTHDGTVSRYRHDPLGRLLEAAGPGATVIHHRDRAGRTTAETCNGRTLTTELDPLGRPVRRTTPSGAVSTFAYDAAGRRTSLTTAGRTLTSTHDPVGRELTRTVGELVTLTQTWDQAGRLTGQTVPGPATHPLRHRGYTYRPDGHLTAVDDPSSGPRTFDLDPAGRVTAVHARGWSERYAYDAAGNQTSAHWPDTMPSPEARGDRAYTGTRITRAGAVRYEHDTLGRVVLRQRTRLSRKPDTWRYTWDDEDRLTSVTTPDGTVWRYCYDPLGRRIAKQRLSPDGTVAEQTDFTWSGPTLVEQTTGPLTLTWDHDGLHPVTQTERVTDATQTETDSRFFTIVTDLVGTPTELIDETGTITWHTRQTLWGTTTWPRTSTAYTPLRFPGQYFDPESELHYNVHRYYDPSTGRYTSPDPLGLGAAPNPVAYVENPHTWVDPLGLAPAGCPKTSTGGHPPDIGGLARRTANTGPFSELQVPMQKRVVNQIAHRAGVGLEGVTVKINRDVDLIGRRLYGYTAPDRTVTLYPDAFTSEEDLVRTIGHERMHVMQLGLYGRASSVEQEGVWEQAAFGAEDQFWNYYNGR